MNIIYKFWFLHQIFNLHVGNIGRERGLSQEFVSQCSGHAKLAMELHHTAPVTPSLLSGLLCHAHDLYMCLRLQQGMTGNTLAKGH